MQEKAEKIESTVEKTKIRFAHSPDGDDAFMFYGIACGGVKAGGCEFVQIAKDIETLNNEAKEGKYEITAISFASYPSVADRYLLMSCGGSFGLNYGPIIVARENVEPQILTNATIAIPGYMTTAYLLLRLYAGLVKVVVLPFQEIIPAVMNGQVEAGLVIHEGQLTYAQSGLKKIVDLGLWWQEHTNLPLPLGGNAIKRNLGEKKIAELTKTVSQSIEYALANYSDALQYAIRFAGNLDHTLADRYIRMYVNEMSIDCGEIGKLAVKKLFELAIEKQIINGGFNPPFM